LRIVPDTNVILSGLLNSKAPPGMLLRAWGKRRFTLVSSEAQLAELNRVFGYPKLRRRIPKHVAGALINRMRKYAVFVDPVPIPIPLPDENDEFVLGTAVAGQAEWLVTGDRSHLLALKKHQRTQIITPAIAVRLLGIKSDR